MKISIIVTAIAVFLTASIDRVSAQDEDGQLQTFRNGGELRLPPFFVSEGGGKSAGKWLYANTPDFVCISLCTRFETDKFVGSFVRYDNKIRNALVPDYLQVGYSVKPVMILLPSWMAKNMTREIRAARSVSSRSLLDVIPQNVLFDDDSLAMTFAGDSVFGIVMTPEHLDQLIIRRTPNVPEWFGYGSVSVFGQANWKDDVIYVPRMTWPEVKVNGRTVPRPIIMQNFFSGAPDGPKTTNSEFGFWIFESNLLLRWAFEGDYHRREALWKFTEALSTYPYGPEREAVVEKLLKQYLGTDMVGLEKEMTNLLPKVRSVGIKMFDARHLKDPDFSVLPATNNQIAFVKGSYDLVALKYVKKVAPAYAEKYAEQAMADILGSYENGDREPEFLALVGLYYYEVGKHDESLSFLETAVKEHITRPSVYISLAEIRFERAMLNPTGPANTFGKEQVRSIFDPLVESVSYSPIQAEAYLVATKLWDHAVVDIPKEEVTAFFDKGMKLTPQNAALKKVISNLRTSVVDN